MVVNPANPAIQPPNRVADPAGNQQPPVKAKRNDRLNAIDRAVLTGVPMEGSVEKKVLIEHVNRLNSIGTNAIRESLKRMIPGRLEEIKFDRDETRQAVHVRRVQPQPPQLQPAAQPAQDHPPQPPQPATPTAQPCL